MLMEGTIGHSRRLLSGDDSRDSITATLPSTVARETQPST